MDFKEFGNRLQLVREEILDMTQTELAQHLNMSQVMYSRAENGLGGNIKFIFDLMNFLQGRKLSGHMLFYEPFDIRHVSVPKKLPLPNARSLEILNQLKESAKGDYEKMILLIDMFS
jgi:transcriptional regulator with XRE-family HTH domain